MKNNRGFVLPAILIIIATAMVVVAGYFVVKSRIVTAPTIDKPPLLSQTPIKQNDCKRTGCSGQLCINSSDYDIITTCEYREEYGCYQKTKCEQQANGQCGFTITDEVQVCLDEAKR